MGTTDASRPDTAETLVAGPTRGAPSTARTRTSLVEPGALIGRYVVIARVGAGGMGAVYTAYDPELDRKVAIKVLHRARGDDASSHEQDTRLVREAQAMAKLNHPNVVSVHDVGTWRGQIFVAMEFVEGSTLGEWMKASRRTWPQILDVMIPAARGLAAAHAAGLVHRDVKPDNVMVAKDGRVRVMDFGLARTGAGEALADPESSDALGIELTREGERLGTPAYMAPEQHLGLAADARSDGFAFCVMLWEALFGERPFHGDSIAALAVAVTEGRQRPPAPGARVPRWLTRIVARGLGADPDARYATIDALVAALLRGRARSRRRKVALAIGSVMLAGAAVVAWSELKERSTKAACDEESDAIAAVWPGLDGEAADRMRAGLLATGASYAEGTADKVEPWLDAYARAWRDAYASICAARRVHHTMSDDLAASASECFDEHRDALETLVVELGQADASMMLRAVAASTGLPSVEQCTDVDALARRPTLPAEQRQAVRAIRQQLGRAGVLDRAAPSSEAVGAVEEALAAARELGWAPLSVDVRGTLGVVLTREGDYERAEHELVAAFDEARAAETPDVAVDAAINLVLVVGSHRARPAEGRLWARLAEGELTRAGLRGGPDEARLLVHIAHLEATAGDYALAGDLHERAIELSARTLAPDHPDMADLFDGLGVIAYNGGDYTRARAHFERALEIREAAFGEDHPDVAASLNNVATLLDTMGASADARPLHERALAIRERALGPHHLDVAQSLNNLATLHRAAGSQRKAKALHERALAIRERTLGPDHPTVATSLNNLAMVERAMGDHTGAKQRFERALAIWERAFGEEHPNVAASLNNLAGVHRDLGELDRARAMHERALAIQEKALGRDHPDLAYALVGLATLAMDRGSPDEAVALLERALAIRDANDLTDDVAETRFALAQALWAAPSERERAVELAEQAAATRRDQGPRRRRDLERVEQWLSARASDR